MDTAVGIVGIIVGGLGIISGGAALLIANRANAVSAEGNNLAKSANATAANALRETEKANDLAKSANDTAENALRETEKANDFAVQANQLADDANTIAKRALHAAQDDVLFEWKFNIEDDGTAVILNDCAHDAAQVTVVVDCGSQPLANAGPTDVEAFDEITLDLRDVVDQHLEEVRRNPPRYAHVDSGMAFGGRPGKAVSTVFRAHLRWHTADQVPRTDVIQQILTHHMTPNGIERITERPQRPSR